MPYTDGERRRMHQCERYIADQGGASASIGGPSRTAPAPPPRPRLGVEWRRVGHLGEHWCLVLNIPCPPPHVSAIRFDENINGEALVAIAGSGTKRAFPVRVVSRQYEVHGYAWTTSRARTLDWRPDPSDPIENHCASVFEAGPGGGRQLERDAPLVRGNSYFALARRPDQWATPPSGYTRTIPGVADCDPRREWEGHLFFIPADAGRAWTEWCSRVFDRGLGDQPASLDLVFPPAAGNRYDGAIVVQNGQSVFLAVRGGCWDEPILEVRDEEAYGPSREFQVAAVAGGLIRAGPFAPGTYSLYLRDWERVALRLAVVEKPLAPGARVVIRTVDPRTGAEQSSDLDTLDGRTRWAGLISGDETWFGIATPERWPVSVMWTASNGACQAREKLLTQEEIGEAVRLCLDSNPTCARIDAGVFGAAVWDKPPVELRGALALTRNARDRLTWLLIATSAAHSVARVPLGHRVPLRPEQIVPADRALVTRFLVAPGWPPPLLTHARSMAAELTRLLQG